MKSLEHKARKLLNKKGQAGGTVGTIIGVIGGVFIGVLFIMLLLYAVGVINVPGLFTAGSYEANTTTAMQKNLTQTADNFTAKLPTVGIIAGVLIIIAIIVLLVLYLGRMRQSATGGSASI